MQLDRKRELVLDLLAVMLIVPFAVVPFVTSSPLYISWTHQIVIGLTASLGVYIMLRLDLLAFTVPAFMAIGGYAAAMFAKAGTTSLVVLLVAAFVTPALFAIPLGALVLRLKGTYFIFVTYIFTRSSSSSSSKRRSSPAGRTALRDCRRRRCWAWSCGRRATCCW
jgi:branched-chain amino acid transport system permease protein